MKFLVIGLGSIGQRHVRNLRLLYGDRHELSTVRTANPTGLLNEHRRAVKDDSVERHYNIRRFKDMEDALSDRPDAVFVTNPTSLHASTALIAAGHGCNLFIEKPVSDELASAEALLDLVESKDLISMVGYQYRFHPCLRRLKRALQDGSLGAIVAARLEVGEYLPDWHPYEDYRKSYAARRVMGGGVLLSQIHELDYVYWLFGFPKKVFAIGGHLSSLDLDVEDVVSVSFECFVDGQLIPVHVHQDYVQRPPKRTCQIIGDKGAINVDLLRNSYERFDDNGQRVENVRFNNFERNQLFLDELKHYSECLLGYESCVIPLGEGIPSLRMALAARESMVSGRAVEIPP